MDSKQEDNFLKGSFGEAKEYNKDNEHLFKKQGELEGKMKQRDALQTVYDMGDPILSPVVEPQLKKAEKSVKTREKTVKNKEKNLEDRNKKINRNRFLKEVGPGVYDYKTPKKQEQIDLIHREAQKENEEKEFNSEMEEAEKIRQEATKLFDEGKETEALTKRQEYNKMVDDINQKLNKAYQAEGKIYLDQMAQVDQEIVSLRQELTDATIPELTQIVNKIKNKDKQKKDIELKLKNEIKPREERIKSLLYDKKPSGDTLYNQAQQEDQEQQRNQEQQEATEDFRGKMKRKLLSLIDWASKHKLMTGVAGAALGGGLTVATGGVYIIPIALFVVGPKIAGYFIEQKNKKLQKQIIDMGDTAPQNLKDDLQERQEFANKYRIASASFAWGAGAGIFLASILPTNMMFPTAAETTFDPSIIDSSGSDLATHDPLTNPDFVAETPLTDPNAIPETPLTDPNALSQQTIHLEQDLGLDPELLDEYIRNGQLKGNNLFIDNTMWNDLPIGEYQNKFVELVQQGVGESEINTKSFMEGLLKINQDVAGQNLVPMDKIQSLANEVIAASKMPLAV